MFESPCLFCAVNLQETHDEFLNEFENAVAYNEKLKDFVNRCQHDLDALTVHRLFKAVTPEDVELLGLHPTRSRPEVQQQ